MQGWLNNEILAFVKSKGKRLIGWNEVLKAKSLDKSVICQYWTPKKRFKSKRLGK
ncbi:MAG: family 20 glycosylhydrolase [Eubacterium sp.]